MLRALPVSCFRTSAALLFSACSIFGCAQISAIQPVAAQNRANIEALSANLGALTPACRALALAQADIAVRRERERLAEALILTRTTISSDSPTEADLADPAAPWSRTLDDRVAALRVRIDGAPLPDRPAAVESLARDHPDIIDIAASTRGFDRARVLRDAVALDALNQRIEAEPAPSLRAGLLSQRDQLLDEYLSVRLAQGSATRSLTTLDTTLSHLDEQRRVALIHARAVAPSDAAFALGTPEQVYRDAALRAAVFDLVTQSSGPSAANDLRDRLARLDSALDALPGSRP